LQVLVQVKSAVGSGEMRTHDLKYEVEYDSRLRAARWQLLPGQGHLVFTAGEGSGDSV